MRAFELPMSPAASALRRASVLLAALLACACATSSTERPSQSVTREENGFTIREDVRVGLSVRSDFSRALRLLDEGRRDEGIAALEKVVEAAPQLTAAHLDLGIAYREKGDLKAAEASLVRARDLSPRHPVVYNELGIVYRHTGRFEEARKSYEKALELYPGFHFARRNLAILCDLYLADPVCALENYERYVQEIPDDEKASMWVADLRRRTGGE